MGASGRASLLSGLQVDEETVRIGSKTYSLRDLVGIKALARGVEVYSCPATSVGCLSGGERAFRRERIAVEAPADVAEDVKATLRAAYPATPRRALVVVNPKGGVGNANRVFQRDVRPVLEAAEVAFEVLVTSRSREATERSRAFAAARFHADRRRTPPKMKPKGSSSPAGAASPQTSPGSGGGAPEPDFDCIVVVGGDGTVWEVVRGLWEGCRETTSTSTTSGAAARQHPTSSSLPGGDVAMRRLDDDDDDMAAKLATIPLCHVPAGSGNALAESIAHAHGDACSAVDAAYAVAKGTVVPLDLVEYELADGRAYPSFLSFEWAMLADVDLGSESLRCLGDLRFHLAAVYRICCLKRYEGTLAYLPFDDDDDDVSTYRSRARLPKLQGNDDLPDGGEKNENHTSSDEESKDHRRSAAVTAEDSSDATSVATTTTTSLIPTLDEKWVVVDASNFHLLVATNLSHLDASTPMAPRALPDDGALHLVWTSGDVGCSEKMQLARGLLKLDQGKHLESPFVHSAKCRAFRLEPAPQSHSRAAIDGEEVPNRPIQASVRPSCLRVFASPPRLGPPITSPLATPPSGAGQETHE